MILETLCVGPMEVNCYILAEDNNSAALIIDPGDEAGKIKKILARHNLRPTFIINTHGHMDHIGADNQFGIPVYIHQQDLGLLKDSRLNLSGVFGIPYTVNSEIRTLQDKERVTLGALQLLVIHVPGHTPGGIALLLEKPEDRVLFSGDSLFCQGIGRTDFPGANAELLIKSIKEKLFSLSHETVVYPGHGPSSTIGEEKKSNPFLT